jgi:hypothetical protein
VVAATWDGVRKGKVGDFVEVWGTGEPTLVSLEHDRVSVGRAPDNDIPIDDGTVSWLHAVFEKYPSGWCVRDVGSSNGTFVNHERVMTEQRLRNGDEVMVGECRLRFRTTVGTQAMTMGAEGPPVITTRERDVLVALCRPLRTGDSFAQPGSIRSIAKELVVSEAAVKFHLANLYDKFGLYEQTENRRVQLANEAIRRRAVTMADLAPPAGTG